MENCCYKCHSTKGLKRYGVTEDGYIVSEEKERMIRTIGRFCGNALANPIPRVQHSHLYLFCPKCAESGKSS